MDTDFSDGRAARTCTSSPTTAACLGFLHLGTCRKPQPGFRPVLVGRACSIVAGVNAAWQRDFDCSMPVFPSTFRSRLMKMVCLGGDLHSDPACNRAWPTTSHLSWRPPHSTLMGPVVTSRGLSMRVRQTSAYPAREYAMHAKPTLLVDVVGKGGLVQTVHLHGGLSLATRIPVRVHTWLVATARSSARHEELLQ